VTKKFCRAWLPSVAGNLVYRLIGTRSSLWGRTGNARLGETRFVIAWQKRAFLATEYNDKDFFADVKSLFRKRYFFLTWMRCEDGQNLYGKAFLFLRTSEWYEIAPKVNRAIDFIIGSRHPSEAYRHAPEEFHENVSADIKKILRELDDVFAFRVEFSIKRDGISDILIEEAKSSNETTERNEFIRRNHLVFPFAEQCFFFIKDISHSHQHHSPYESSITRLHQYSSAQAHNWAHATVKDMLKRIIQLKGEMRADKVASSLGILAYLRAFEKVLIKNNIISSGNQCYEELGASILARREFLVSAGERKREATRLYLTITLAILGALFGLVGVARVADESLLQISQVSSFINFLAESMLNLPLSFLLICCLGTYFFLIALKLLSATSHFKIILRNLIRGLQIVWDRVELVIHHIAFRRGIFKIFSGAFYVPLLNKLRRLRWRTRR
jgi:hypothetical protein